jgi:hypothetical protein
LDQIQFISSGSSAEEIIGNKRIHFAGSNLFPEWNTFNAVESIRSIEGYLLQRQASTTGDMKVKWNSATASALDGNIDKTDARLIKQILNNENYINQDKIINDIKLIPERLQGQAFLWSVISQTGILPLNNYSHIKREIEIILAYQWLTGHVLEFNTFFASELQGIGDIQCGIKLSDNIQNISIIQLKKILSWLGLSKLIDSCTLEEIVKVKSLLEFNLIKTEFIQPLFNGSFDSLTLDYEKKIYTIKEHLRKNKEYNNLHDTCLAIGDIIASSYSGSSTQGLLFPQHRKKTLRYMASKRIFIGHGRSDVWLKLKDFIRDRLELEYDEFNRVPVAGRTTSERLKEMLEEAGMAFIILTAEDEHLDGTIRARQNVIHELGLFQGKLGFEKAIVLLEEGCEEFSNIHGLSQIRFPKNNVLAKSEDLRRLVEERMI